MIKERIIILLTGILVLSSALIAIYINLSEYIIISMLLVGISVVIIMELYVRIQWNIEKINNNNSQKIMLLLERIIELLEFEMNYKRKR